MPKNIKSVLSWSVSKEMLPTYFRATQNEATSYIVALKDNIPTGCNQILRINHDGLKGSLILNIQSYPSRFGQKIYLPLLEVSPTSRASEGLNVKRQDDTSNQFSKHTKLIF
jgi:hypothetical protein